MHPEQVGHLLLGAAVALSLYNMAYPPILPRTNIKFQSGLLEMRAQRTELRREYL